MVKARLRDTINCMNILDLKVSELDTPQAIVDLDKLEANIHKAQAYLDEHGLVSRPHIKTHKNTEIARMQLAAGAQGITCQKISEAEIMADGGIKDIFIPYNILGEAKLERLMTLARRIRVSVTADSRVTVEGLSRAFERSGISLPVLVEFDTGGGRCGVQTPAEAADLARLIGKSPGLEFTGLMTYPVNEYTDTFVRETRKLPGISFDVVSAGGSPQLWNAHQYKEITEYRVGTYVYGDRYTVEAGTHTLDACAFHVRAMVVSRPTPDRGILDAGSKALSSDLLGQDGHGLILEYPEARIYGLSEEHGNVDFSACSSKPDIGEKVTILPNHCCVCNNLFNEITGIRNGRVEKVWKVEARGSLQ